MNVPLELHFDVSVPKDPLEDLVRERTAKLDRICDHLSSCRVSVEESQKHLKTGSPFRVRIDLTVPPGHELATSTEPGDSEMHEGPDTIIRKTFDAAERRLKKLMDVQRGETKSHPTQEAARRRDLP